MTDKRIFAAVPQGRLTEARLYLGDTDFEIHSFDHPLGSLASAVAAQDGKTNGNEDSAGIIPVADD